MQGVVRRRAQRSRLLAMWTLTLGPFTRLISLNLLLATAVSFGGINCLELEGFALPKTGLHFCPERGEHCYLVRINIFCFCWDLGGLKGAKVGIFFTFCFLGVVGFGADLGATATFFNFFFIVWKWGQRKVGESVGQSARAPATVFVGDEGCPSDGETCLITGNHS